MSHGRIPGGDSTSRVTPPGTNYDWACLNVSTAAPSGGSVTLAPSPVALGQQMTATTSGWTNATYFDYSWQRNGSATCRRAGRTARTTPTARARRLIQTPRRLRSTPACCYQVRVNARNAFASSGVDPVSNQVVMNLPPAPTGGSVSLSPTGTANAGQVLTGSTVNGDSNNNPTSYTFEFQRGPSGTACGSVDRAHGRTWTTT